MRIKTLPLARNRTQIVRLPKTSSPLGIRNQGMSLLVPKRTLVIGFLSGIFSAASAFSLHCQCLEILFFLANFLALRDAPLAFQIMAILALMAILAIPRFSFGCGSATL